MTRKRSVIALAPLLLGAACLHTGAQQSSLVAAIPSVSITESRAFDTYAPIPREVAANLGCVSSPGLPICEVTPPSPEEDSAFQAEGARLRNHSDAKCRDLGYAIEANRASVRMYRKALVRETDNGRLFGVGHTYAVDDAWLVRVARRIDDLNERTLEEKTRTLRHEMSHTIGATESPDGGWSAEDYASRCAGD